MPNAQRSIALWLLAFSILHLFSYGGFAKGVHLFPYRTEKLSPLWPMVLHNNAEE
jgi:hypothetical protein